MTEPEVRTDSRGVWRRVYIEADGREVSHLSYAALVFPVGRQAAVRMAGIGGVGTDPQFRRRGLAHRVFAKAMSEIKAAGYSCAGLYTAADIVAHRLYRRFGFVDIVVHEPAVKLLDPAAFVTQRLTRALSEAASHRPDIADWRCALTIQLADGPDLHLHIEGGGAHVVERPPRQPDLSLATSQSVLIQLCYGTMTLPFAEVARLIRWRGDAAHWQRLSAVTAMSYPLVNEGTL